MAKSYLSKLYIMNYDYFIIHGTDLKRLYNILKEGKIYANKYIDKKFIRLAGWERLPYVYTNIFFNDLQNIETSFGISLILHPKILYEQVSIFNEKWQVHPTEESIYLNPFDGKKSIDEKLNLIKLKISKNLNEKNKVLQIMNHELLFIARICLDDYLIGILCPGCNMNEIIKIQNLLKKYKYENVKIFDHGGVSLISNIIIKNQ